MNNNEQLQLMSKLSLQIFKLNGLLVEEGARMTDDINVSNARWRVLGTLTRANAPLTVPHIAREMGQTRQSIQRLVDAMCKDGFVSYQDNPGHAKSKNISLTSSGIQTYASLADRQFRSLAFMAKGLNLNEMKQGAALLDSLILKLDIQQND